MSLITKEEQETSKICSERGKRELTLFKNRIWMNKEEAADYLRITPQALQMRIFRKQIKPFRIGNSLRFNRFELDKLLETSRNVKEVSNGN